MRVIVLMLLVVGLMTGTAAAQPPTYDAAGTRNTFFVDYTAFPPPWGMDGYFPVVNDPQADFYPNLFGSGFVGIDNGDQKKIDLYPLAPNRPGAIELKRLANFPYPARYDATWCEDGNLYILGDSRVMICDIRTGQTRSVDLVGPPPGPGAIWSQPWEQAGMLGYICSDADDTIYAVDFAANPMVGLVVTKLPTAATVITGRSADEAELISYWRNRRNGDRYFDVQSDSSVAGEGCVLALSNRGLPSTPLVLDGLEVWLGINWITIAGINGWLGYRPTTGLDARGSAQIYWPGIGYRMGHRLSFQVVVFDYYGRFLEASNIINVEV